MPVSDERLGDALRGSAREPSLDGVAERVHAKRARRHTIRRVERAALAGGLLAALIVAGVVVFDTGGGDQRVAAPPAHGVIPVVRVVGTKGVHRVAVTPVHLATDQGYVRSPLVLSGNHVESAAYDRSGTSYTFPPSRIVRVDVDGTVVDRVDLLGEILSLADGEGARWALTHDKTVLGPNDPEFRVKRIGPDGSIASNPVPPGEHPVGRIVAGGGGVWVPVRDGVLRFDSVTGVFAAKVALTTTTDRREVAALGKSVSVTDGAEVKRLDPGSDRVAGSGGFGQPAPVPAGFEYVDLVGGPNGGASALARDAANGHWLLDVVDISATVPRDQRSALPAGFVPDRLQVTGTTTWVIGRLHGSLVVLEYRVGNSQLVRTITVANTHDADVVLLSGTRMVVASNGSLYRVRIPE